MASWLVPLFALAMSATFLVESFSLKRMPGADPAGPALYPRMVIAGTALAAIVILAQLAWRARGRVRLAGWRALFAAEGGAADRNLGTRSRAHAGFAQNRRPAAVSHRPLSRDLGSRSGPAPAWNSAPKVAPFQAGKPLAPIRPSHIAPAEIWS